MPDNIIPAPSGRSRTSTIDLEGPFAVEAGDVCLLCSDGLTGQVTNQQMAAVPSAWPPAEAYTASSSTWPTCRRTRQRHRALIIRIPPRPEANGAGGSPPKPRLPRQGVVELLALAGPALAFGARPRYTSTACPASCSSSCCAGQIAIVARLVGLGPDPRDGRQAAAEEPSAPPARPRRPPPDRGAADRPSTHAVALLTAQQGRCRWAPDMPMFTNTTIAPSCSKSRTWSGAFPRTVQGPAAAGTALGQRRRRKRSSNPMSDKSPDALRRKMRPGYLRAGAASLTADCGRSPGYPRSTWPHCQERPPRLTALAQHRGLGRFRRAG